MQIFGEPKFWASTSNEKNSSVLLTGFNFLVQYRFGDKEKCDGHRTGRSLTVNVARELVKLKGQPKVGSQVLKLARYKRNTS